MRRIAFVILLGWSIRIEAREPSIRVEPVGTESGAVVVTYDPGTTPEGLAVVAGFEPAKGSERLPFSVADAAAAETPVLGTYSMEAGRILFRPRFALYPGTTYSVRASSPAQVDEPRRIVVSATYTAPRRVGSSPPQVASITPGGDRLPANVLRFYITFSRPMREGREVLERIRLLDDAGSEIVSPWRDLELWNADATRLSLFLHPGRIKQGVNLRVELGPILEPGRRYTLVVGGELQDARGEPLGRELRRSFTTTDELRERIDVARWRMAPPHSDSRNPLVVDFGRTLDAALVRRCLHVRDAAGDDLAGSIDVSDDQRRWTFVPAEPWQGRRYVLVVDPVLEDVCGNSPLRAFDVDLEAPEVDVLPLVLRREFTPQ